VLTECVKAIHTPEKYYLTAHPLLF